MNLSAPFIDRPVATTLLTLGIALAGAHRVPSAAGLAAAAGGLSDDLRAGVAARRESRNDGGDGRDAARALAWPHRGRHGDDFVERAGHRRGSRCSSTSTRDIDGAARDVQAAINAARSVLPTGLPSNPTYRKVNPADAPIMILTLTSDTMTQGQMYDAASTIIAQKLSQIPGVGQVSVGGSSLPAVRVELKPPALNKYGVGLEDVRAALAAANANRPKGSVEEGDRHWQIYANDQAKTAAEYLPLIVAYRNGAPVQLTDVADVVDSVQDLRNAGMANGKPSVLVIVNRQPNANIIETVDRVTALLPSLARVHSERDRPAAGDGAHGDDPRFAARRRTRADGLDRARDPGRLRLPARRPRDVDPERRRAGLARRHVRRDVSVRLQRSTTSR